MLGTPRQLAALRAYVTHGGVKQAAFALGVSESTVKHSLQALRDRTGLTTPQLAYRLGQSDGPDQLELWLLPVAA